MGTQLKGLLLVLLVVGLGTPAQMPTIFRKFGDDGAGVDGRCQDFILGFSVGLFDGAKWDTGRDGGDRWGLE